MALMFGKVCQGQIVALDTPRKTFEKVLSKSPRSRTCFRTRGAATDVENAYDKLSKMINRKIQNGKAY